MNDTNKNAVETNVQPAAVEEKAEVTNPVTEPVKVEEDLEAKYLALEQENTRLSKEKDNYKEGLLKLKKKKGIEDEDSSLNSEDRVREIAEEVVAQTRMAEILREQDLIIKKALRENKELKLAMTNKSTTPPAGTAVHSESKPVQSTSVTADQMAYFKSKGWSDKDIERYKRNLQKSGK